MHSLAGQPIFNSLAHPLVEALVADAGMLRTLTPAARIGVAGVE